MDLRMVHFRVWISRSEVWETSRCLEITCFGPLLDPFWTPFGRSWEPLGSMVQHEARANTPKGNMGGILAPCSTTTPRC